MRLALRPSLSTAPRPQTVSAACVALTTAAPTAPYNPHGGGRGGAVPVTPPLCVALHATDNILSHLPQSQCALPSLYSLCVLC
jgi:hypothetical protein